MSGEKRRGCSVDIGNERWEGRRRNSSRCTGHRPNAVLMCIVAVVVVVAKESTVVTAAAAVAAKAKSTTEPTTVDVCREDSDSTVQCGSGFVVHVHELHCGLKDTLRCDPRIRDLFFRLCQGRASCAPLGLREVFRDHCLSFPSGRRLLVSYTCQPAPTRPPACRANLCSNGTQGLTCPALSVLHVHKVTCGDGQLTCSTATFVTLYSLCEGRRECDASGLRMLTPLSMYCQVERSSSEARNVFVDFFCVPEKLVHKTCGARDADLKEPFGVVMNLASVGSSPATTTPSTFCSWFVSPAGPDSEVLVMIHMAYSKWNDRNCSNTLFLQVHYKDCDSQQMIKRDFCDLSHINSPLRACGTVKVVSWKPVVSGDPHGFLVSYQMASENGSLTSSEQWTPGGMAECSTRLTTIPVSTTLKASVTIQPTVASRNYGPGKTMFDYSDTIRHTAIDSGSKDNPTDDSLQLKLIILYIFFGVVILALVVALLYVVVSYRGISRRKRHSSESSERTALCRYDDTPMDTFTHSSRVSLVDVANCNLYSPSPEPPPQPPPPPLPSHHHVVDDGPAEDVQVVACTVHSKPPVDDDEEDYFRLSTGSAFSSFLSGKDMDLQDLLDSFNPYDTIAGDYVPPTKTEEEEGGGGGGGTRSSSAMTNSEMSNIYEAIDSEPVYKDDHGVYHNNGDKASPELGACYVGRHLQNDDSALMFSSSLENAKDDNHSSDPSPVEHYTINNDDYALVKKPKSSLMSHKVSPAPDNIFTNFPCIQQETDISPGDPAYDTVDIFQKPSGPVVGFRNTSGHCDNDENRNGESLLPS